jgi:predicted metal-dependent phosphoesterase TrpH
MLNFENLHSHTLISDGQQTHLEVLNSAKQYGIGVLAFTDHDTLPDENILKSLRAYDGPVKWTIGLEMSSYVPLEVGGPDEGALHILALFVDLGNQALREFCTEAEHGRRRRMQLVLEHLHEQGFEITEAEVEAAATSKNIVLPHIVTAMMGHQKNRLRLDQLREQMHREAEHDPELKRKYDEMMADGPRQYPYALVVTRRAYRPMTKHEISNLLDLDKTVALIRQAGGLALLAHWYHDESKLPEAALAKLLERGGLDGLETAGVNTIGQRDMSGEIERTGSLVRRYDVAEVVGSDSHSAADLAAFAESRYAQQSVGQTARLIERYQPDLRWSNLQK